MQLQPYTPVKTASVDARCPHGAMPGSCPACGGGGGGGGGGAKKSGLMGWNEAFATWNAIKFANTRNRDYLESVSLNRDRLQNESRANTGNPSVASAFLLRLVQLAANVQSGLLHSLGNAWKSLFSGTAFQTANPQQMNQSPIAKVGIIITDLTGKIASLLGDAKQFIEEMLHNNLEMLKSLIANWGERLAQVQQMFGRLMGRLSFKPILQNLKRGVRSVLKKLAKLLKREDLSEDEDPPKDEGRRTWG